MAAAQQIYFLFASFHVQTILPFAVVQVLQYYPKCSLNRKDRRAIFTD